MESLSADRESYGGELPVSWRGGIGWTTIPLEGVLAMAARKLFVFIVVAMFSLGLASPGFSAGMVEDAKGTVTKIEGGKVSIKDSMGEKTIEPNNPGVITDLKVGDQVSVRDGKLTKEGGAGTSAPPRAPGY